MSTKYFICCDKCGEQVLCLRTIQRTRKNLAKRWGWVTEENHSGKKLDYCPVCAKQRGVSK